MDILDESEGGEPGESIEYWFFIPDPGWTGWAGLAPSDFAARKGDKWIDAKVSGKGQVYFPDLVTGIDPLAARFAALAEGVCFLDGGGAEPSYYPSEWLAGHQPNLAEAIASAAAAVLARVPSEPSG